MLRVGTDLIEIVRIEEAVERWGERFLEQIFTPSERAAYGERIPRWPRALPPKKPPRKRSAPG